MVSPKSAQYCRISSGDKAELIRSFSNSSTPSKPAAAAASSLSSNVPDRHTVAMTRRGSPVSDMRSSLLDEHLEMLEHPFGVGFDAGEQLESLHGLEHGHSATVQHAAAAFGGRVDQFGAQRPVHHVGHPQLRAQQLGRHGAAGVGG